MDQGERVRGEISRLCMSVRTTAWTPTIFRKKTVVASSSARIEYTEYSVSRERRDNDGDARHSIPRAFAWGPKRRRRRKSRPNRRKRRRHMEEMLEMQRMRSETMVRGYSASVESSSTGSTTCNAGTHRLTDSLGAFPLLTQVPRRLRLLPHLLHLPHRESCRSRPSRGWS